MSAHTAASRISYNCTQYILKCKITKYISKNCIYVSTISMSVCIQKAGAEFLVSELKARGLDKMFSNCVHKTTKNKSITDEFSFFSRLN